MEGKTGCDLNKYKDLRQKAQVEISLPRLELIDIIDCMLIKPFIRKDSGATKSKFTS